jgi:BirA family biotin operon repressor/biotin-[acetyl-CoA-carboxylase] ligase
MNTQIGKKLIWLSEIDSTNKYLTTLSKEQLDEGLAVATNNQVEGRGQRGNTWESEKDKNITFSFILYPKFLKVQEQFILSQAISLGICDMLLQYTKGISIKWPNDIYVNNNKIAGILIENAISSAQLDQSIVGIGLNVNQKTFSDDIPNPTSLALETGYVFDLKETIGLLCSRISARYNDLRNNGFDVIQAEYLNLLYRRNEFYTYSSDGKKFEAIIAGVKGTGELILESRNGERKEFGFKEISFF